MQPIAKGAYCRSPRRMWWLTLSIFVSLAGCESRTSIDHASSAVTASTLRQCDTPHDQATISSATDWRATLNGAYSLVMVREMPGMPPDTARGRMILRAPDPNYDELRPRAHDPSHVVPVLLVGNTDIDLLSLGVIGLIHSATSTDPDRPGVQMIHGGGLMLGNARSMKHSSGLHAGVSLTIVSLGKDAFSGGWADNALSPRAPSGHFCAFRLTK